jgi:hypothetical protein
MARGKQKDKIAMLERQLLALDLRKQGMTYRQIATRLECNHVTIYNDIHRELKRLADESQDSTAEMRQLDLERIDMAIAGLMPFVRSGSANHTMALMKSIDERAKLLGLYAPEKQEMVIDDRLSDDERANRIAAILERSRARRDGRTPESTIH